MKKNGIICVLLFLFGGLASCGEAKKEPATANEKRETPEVTSLDQLKKTDFLLTPRHPISADRNGIYSSVMLYAWNEVKKKLEGNAKIDSLNVDVYALNESPYYIHSIDPAELKAEAKVDKSGEEGVIQIHTEHHKSLPFPRKMIRFDHSMNFRGTQVEAFGLANNENQMNEMSEILYYKDDSEFAITLYPEDTAYEIVLYKPARTDFKYLKDVILDLNGKIEAGNKSLDKNEHDWRYTYLEKDLLAIPVISFDLEYHYPALEKFHFFTDKNRGYTIAEAYQHTAFTLNEKGAEITGESDMIVPADSAYAVPSKNFVFDGPFLLLVTWHHERPFLAAWITNPELMEKKAKKNL